jgi:hypothetical protein
MGTRHSDRGRVGHWAGKRRGQDQRTTCEMVICYLPAVIIQGGSKSERIETESVAKGFIVGEQRGDGGCGRGESGDESVKKAERAHTE